MKNYLDLAGRILLAVLFVMAGWSKIGGYAGTQAYMATAGVPGFLLPLVIVLELGGGIAVVLGLFTRPIALALAGFSLLSALLFHADFGDRMQTILFMKNFAIAGGFFILAANGAGCFSLDGWRSRRRTA